MNAKKIPVSAGTLKNALGISSEILGVYYDTNEELFYIYTDEDELEKEPVVLEMDYA